MTGWRGWRNALGFALVAVAVTAAAEDTRLAQPLLKARAGVGVNLGAWLDYNTDLPTIDQFKRARGWLTQCWPWVDPACAGFAEGASNFDTGEQAHLDLDADGWVRSLAPVRGAKTKYRVVSALLFQGDGGARPTGRYTVTYDGQGVLQYSLAGKLISAESRPGHDVVEVSGDPDAGLLISIAQTNPKDYIRNIRVVPPGGICDKAPATFVESSQGCKKAHNGAFVPLWKLAATQIWHPDYLRDLRGFRAVRFLDWTHASESELSAWAERPRPSSAFWSGAFGVPVEAMISLANSTGADPWITVPARVDDDYLRQFVRMVNASLDPDRILYLEYGNEPWNYASKQSHWIKERAAARWTGSAAKGLDPYVVATNGYALRAAQACRIVKAAFEGRGGRVRCVANVQAANPASIEQTLSCVLAAPVLGERCDKIFDAVAIAPYFGHSVMESAGRDRVLGWLREPDGGIGSLFDELWGVRDTLAPLRQSKGTMPEGPSRGAMALARQWMQAAKAVSDRHGLPLLAYEGGQHLMAEPGEANEKIYGLLAKANLDARMADTYRRHLDDWRQVGGQLFMFYAHVAKPSRYGNWGLKQRQSAQTDPKWRVALDYRDRTACWWPTCAP